MRSKLGVAALSLLLGTVAFAQSEFSSPKPAVSVLRVDSPSLPKGKSAAVSLTFHVANGFHINSNRPNSQLLIPTTLHLNPPTDLSVGNVQYPDGEQLALSFSPDEKLSVYTGDFTVHATARTVGSIHTGAYRVHGQLKFQACDDHACYPPKSVDVAFDVHVVPPPSKGGRKNPAQSPNVHQ